MPFKYNMLRGWKGGTFTVKHNTPTLKWKSGDRNGEPSQSSHCWTRYSVLLTTVIKSSYVSYNSLPFRLSSPSSSHAADLTLTGGFWGFYLFLFFSFLSVISATSSSAKKIRGARRFLPGRQQHHRALNLTQITPFSPFACSTWSRMIGYVNDLINNVYVSIEEARSVRIPLSRPQPPPPPRAVRRDCRKTLWETSGSDDEQQRQGVHAYKHNLITVQKCSIIQYIYMHLSNLITGRLWVYGKKIK